MFKKTYLPVTLISKRVERRLNLYVKKRFTLCLETPGLVGARVDRIGSVGI